MVKNITRTIAVVPGYYLVCYNKTGQFMPPTLAVVPGYYLVCYNFTEYRNIFITAVVPGYYLVCYNNGILPEQAYTGCSSRLLLGML